jgi:hypothetical protein
MLFQAGTLLIQMARLFHPGEYNRTSLFAGVLNWLPSRDTISLENTKVKCNFKTKTYNFGIAIEK